MKVGLKLAVLTFSLLGGMLVGCGGSASETAWPVEPDNIDLGPQGESRRDNNLIKKPDNQTDSPADPTVPKPKKAEPAAP